MGSRCKVTFVVDPRVLDLLDSIADEKRCRTSRLVESIFVHFLRFEVERRARAAARVDEAVAPSIIRERQQLVQLLPSPVELDGALPSVFNRRPTRRKQKRV